MSSLDARTGHLLSLAWVPVDGAIIHAGRGEHRLLLATGDVGDSATIHGIRDRDLVQGEDPGTVLSAFLAAAAGRIAVFHHAPLDLAFLNRLHRRCYGLPLSLSVIDTLARERRRRQRRGLLIAPGDLTLAACRRHYGLPDYPAHDALGDALATAELLLAQLVHAGEDVTLRDLCRPVKKS